MVLNNKFVDFYKKYPDYVQTILQTQYMTVTQSDLMFFFANRSTDYYMEILTSLNKDYGYNLADVFVYMDKIMTFEAIVAINWLLRELRDYARMISKTFQNNNGYCHKKLQKITKRIFGRSL